MLFNSITLVEGSELQNLVVSKGAAFPGGVLLEGQLFYRTDGLNEGLYVYDGSTWIRIEDANTKLKFTPVNVAGDTMTGHLTLSGNPTTAMHAATKQYVDSYSHTFASLSAKPTTLAGFGIVDGQPLDSDLTAIAGLTSTGIVIRTGDGTAATRSLVGTAGRIVITNGNGVNGSPTLDLDPVGTAGTYFSVNTDIYGRVTSGLASINTDAVTEGSNLYFTTARARAAISATGSLSYDSATGVLSFTMPPQNTSNITEGSNLYYTDARARAAISLTAGTSGATYTSGTLNLSSVAPLASPNFTGIPTAPTATAGTNTTQIATTAYVQDAIAGVEGGEVASAAKWTTARNLSLTGDATATLTGVDGTDNVSASITLATVNSNTGSFGNASSVPTLTLNAKGQVTAASNTSIAISATQLTSGTLPDARVAQSNITQHQASLSISESRLVNGSLLARLADDETVSGSWTFSQPVSGVDPSSGAHLVTKQYVDNIATGLTFKASVKAATTSDITLTGNQTVDGIPLVDGDRVLVKNQTDATQNGIYDVATGAWTRSPDADNTPGQEIFAGMYCFVEEGTANADSGWVLTTTGTITLGVTNLDFAQFSGLGQIEAGNGLVKVGSVLSVNSASSDRIAVSSSGVDLATVANSGTGNFRKITIDSYGRVTGTTPVIASDLTALITTSNLDEGSNLYFTNARARAALSVTGSGISFNTSTGQISLSSASTNTASTLVLRDGNGNFATNTISIGSTGAAGQVRLARGDTGAIQWVIGASGAAGATEFLVHDAVAGQNRFTIQTDGVMTSFVSGTQRLQVNATGASVTGNLSTSSAFSSGGHVFLNGAAGEYASFNSAATINYAGNGTQYGMTLKPASGTANTNILAFLSSSSTYASATLVGSIQQLAGDSVLNLNGTWRLNNVQIATTSSNISGTAANVTGIVAVENGGTGASTAEQARTNLGLATVASTGSYNDLTNKPSIVRQTVQSVAATGTTQGTAAAITGGVVVVTTATGSANGVILPASMEGGQIIVVNTTAVAVSVYPPSSGSIDAIATNTAFSLPAGGRIMFIATASTKYYTLNATYS